MIEDQYYADQFTDAELNCQPTSQTTAEQSRSSSSSTVSYGRTDQSGRFGGILRSKDRGHSILRVMRADA
jgi:hypothetical protein